MDALPDRTLRERAAQLIMARIGSNMQPPVTVGEDLARVEALLERCPIGGLMLFNGTRAETPPALAALQRRSRDPLLVATDMERGVGQQVRGATVFPHAMAYSALGEKAEPLLEASARASAREALACGIHVTFSPVADVNSDPRNPIIATRAFGTEPEGVARLVRAYHRGCQAEGLLTTAKHFPGHGNTSQDSHAELPIVDSDRETLERIDLAPFRAAIEAGVDLVMSAHIAYPALDATQAPATLSHVILHDLLRDQLGFTGAVITDSLLMGGIQDTHPEPGEQAAALLAAGVDILLDVADPEAVVEGLVAAVEAGRLPEARLNEAFGRVWRLKQRLIDRFGLAYFTDSGSIFEEDPIGTPDHARLAEEVAARAVTVISAREHALPFEAGAAGAEADVVGVLVKPYRSRLDAPEEPLGEAWRDAFPSGVYYEVGPEADAALLEEIHRAAAGARHVAVAMVVKPAAWHAFGLRPEQQRFVERLVAERPVVLASLGSPYALDAFPEAAARLCTYSDVRASQQALAAVLAGTVPLPE